MRNRQLLVNSGLPFLFCLVLAACGKSPSSGTGPAESSPEIRTEAPLPQDPTADSPPVIVNEEPGSGNPALQALMDKRLRLTRMIVLDSSGRFLDELCGEGRICQADDIFLTSHGEWIIDECDGKCALDDPRNERAAWTFDESRNELRVIDDRQSIRTYRILESTGTTILLAVPGGDIDWTIAVATGGVPASPGPGALLLQTYSVE